MAVHQDKAPTLEYLVLLMELHQDKAPFLMQRCSDLDAQKHALAQRLKMQQLDHESLDRSLREENQRLLRELSQHKVLFDQRGRQLEQLRERSELPGQVGEKDKLSQERVAKLSEVAEQLAGDEKDEVVGCLRRVAENMKQENLALTRNSNTARDVHDLACDQMSFVFVCYLFSHVCKIFRENSQRFTVHSRRTRLCHHVSLSREIKQEVI